MNYTGEGIMTQINSLVAPPQASSSSGGNKKDPSAYKKTGRSHKDVCVACGDGGDMLSCDRCSTTMHSLCADPPIDEEETRPIRWTCRSCHYVVSCLNLPNDNLTKGGKKKVGKKKADPTNATVPTTSETIKKVVAAPERQMDSNTPVRNIFDQLMPEMRKLNPVEFSLPSDFPTYDHQFPGASRQLYKKSASAKPKPLVVEEADVGTCLKKKVFCFQCSKSCRLKPLIKCDYCSAYYHFDCLNPPLITAPVGIWQCPLHVEPFLESNTLETTKLSERVRLWGKVTEPINTASVISKFFRRTFNPNPMFHHKIEINRNKTAEVPDYVIGFYDNNLYNLQDESIVNDDPPSAKKVKYTESLNREYTQNTTEIFNISDDLVGDHGPKLTSLDMLVKVAEDVEFCETALEGLDMTTIKKLATRQLFRQRWEGQLKRSFSQLIAPEKSPDNKKQIEKPLLHTTFTKMRPVLSLVCINSMKKITIRSKSVSIGIGDGVTVDLSKMTSCRGVSVRHAVISYDNLQCRWELVNYSPNGTTVDDCFLGCDFTPELRETNKYADSPEFSLKKYLMDRNKLALKFYSKLDPFTQLQKCKCLQSVLPSLRSWEGPIPLKAKSLIKIGCVALLVTTIDYVEDEVKIPMFKPYPVERHEKKVKLDNALTQCLPPRPEESQSHLPTKTAANPSKVISQVTAKSGKRVQNADKSLKIESAKSSKGNLLEVEKEFKKEKLAVTVEDLSKEKLQETLKELPKETPIAKEKEIPVGLDTKKEKEKRIQTGKELPKETNVEMKKLSPKEKTQDIKKPMSKETPLPTIKVSPKEKSPETKKVSPNVKSLETEKGSSNEKILVTEINAPKKSKMNIKKVDDKGKIVSGVPLKKMESKMKMKREIVVSGRSLSHPFAQPRLIPPLSKLVATKLSPKKLVNYFDTTKKPEVSDVKVKSDKDGQVVMKKPEKETAESIPGKSKSEGPEVQIVKTVCYTQSAVKQPPKCPIDPKSHIDPKITITPPVPLATNMLRPPKTSPSIATKFGPVFKP